MVIRLTNHSVMGLGQESQKLGSVFGFVSFFFLTQNMV